MYTLLYSKCEERVNLWYMQGLYLDVIMNCQGTCLVLWWKVYLRATCGTVHMIDSEVTALMTTVRWLNCDWRISASCTCAAFNRIFASWNDLFIRLEEIIYLPILLFCETLPIVFFSALPLFSLFSWNIFWEQISYSARDRSLQAGTEAMHGLHTS